MADTPTTPEPKRRWSRFSLRTLLIAVALLSTVLGYFGHEAMIVRERRAARDEILGVAGSRFTPNRAFIGETKSKSQISWLRSLFGDVNYGYVLLPPDTDKEYRDVIRRIFPEA